MVLSHAHPPTVAGFLMPTRRGAAVSYIEANLTFATDDTAAALAAWEILNRFAAGIAFEGIRVELSLDRINDPEDDELDDDETLADTTAEDE